MLQHFLVLCLLLFIKAFHTVSQLYTPTTHSTRTEMFFGDSACHTAWISAMLYLLEIYAINMTLVLFPSLALISFDDVSFSSKHVRTDNIPQFLITLI